MKTPVLILTVLGCSWAVPNGYYHQEYNYKTSSSAFKNNELQHKTDDQGYYKKDGDLEGRYKPKIDSNSEHSEYVNPNSQNNRNDYNTDLNSLGHMRANTDYGTGVYGINTNQLGEDMAHSDRISGSQSGISSGYDSNSYRTGSSRYGVSSNLRTITTRIQQECERDLLDTIRRNAGYGSSALMLGELERQFRQNLTERLNNELTRSYGQQTIRDGKSYTLSGGRLQTNANYDNQEYEDLKNQLENSLLNKLRNQYYQYSSSSSSQQHYDNRDSYVYTTTPRPAYPINYYTTTTYRPIYPTIPVDRYPNIPVDRYPNIPAHRYPSIPVDRYPTDNIHNSQSQYQTIHTRYTPVSNPESLTQLASKVQSRLDTNLNELLDETRRTHFSSSQTASLVNPDVLLDRLRNELRTNISYNLDEIIRENYGNQMKQDGYMYSVGSNGQRSGDYNYGVQDLENLREQIERNLVNKLNKDFEQTRRSWSSQQSYSSQSSYGSNSGSSYGSNAGSSYGTNAGYNYGSNSGHTSIPSGVKTHDYGSESRYTGESTGNMAQLQRQMQSDLSRQLNIAMNKESQSSSGYSAVNPQNYQQSLQELTDELNRNLTRNIQEYSASGSYAAYGNFDRSQLATLKAKLQENLMNELRDGLDRSLKTHKSYSASSSSSSSGSYNAGTGYNYQDGQHRSKREATKGLVNENSSKQEFAVTA